MIDTHCHLDKPRYRRDMKKILQNAQENKVKGILIPMTHKATIADAQGLSESYKGVFYSVGYHPKYADQFDVSVLEEYVHDERCIAIGEFGLDYGRLSKEEEVRTPIVSEQKCVLKMHLEFAVKHQKPVLIHLRDKHVKVDGEKTAYDDFLEILQPYLGKLVGGVIHAMNFNRDDYLALAKHHFYFGIGGQLTYDRFEELKSFVQKAPFTSLLLETDSPWLTPTVRKKEMQKVANEPAFIVDVLEELSVVLNMEKSKLEEVLLDNTLRIFPAFEESVKSRAYSVGRVKSVELLGAEVIRQVATEVEAIESEETQELIEDLLLTCINSRGMGIASPQIAVSKRLFIMASQPNNRYPHAPKMKPKAVINPKILSYSEETKKDWEGCLSLPNVRALVPRSLQIEVSYFTRDGKEVQEVLEGFLARLFQHEFDHLDGKVFIDRIESTQDVVMEREYLRMVHTK